MKLSEDERGLYVEAQLDPTDADAAKLITKLEAVVTASGFPSTRDFFTLLINRQTARGWRQTSPELLSRLNFGHIRK